MKALVRNEFETVTQDMGFTFIEWDTGAPLTNAEWAGGPGTLVNDYVQEVPVEGTEEPQSIQSTPVDEKSAEQPSEALPETVTIDGKTYTMDELLALLNQTN